MDETIEFIYVNYNIVGKIRQIDGSLCNFNIDCMEGKWACFFIIISERN